MSSFFRNTQMNRIESEVVYLLREAAKDNMVLNILCDNESARRRITELAEIALYPECPELFFCEDQNFVDAEYPDLRPTGQERTLLFHTHKQIRMHRPQMWHFYNLLLQKDTTLLLRPFMGLDQRVMESRKKRMIKLITCGGVDDGKSTLIGRLLFESRTEDEKKELMSRSELLRKDQTLDYALLASESREESEQGITVSVSYSWFETQEHCFLMADTPGHEEYTRNMAYGASGADIGIIMIGAGKGIVAQTKRHIRICVFMGITRFIFAINKMDLCDYKESVYLQIKDELEQFMAQFTYREISFIPVAAKAGVNITAMGNEMPWYHGRDLLAEIDGIAKSHLLDDEPRGSFSMPVQRVCKSSQIKGAEIARRQYQGEVSGHEISITDELYVLPTMEKSTIAQLFVNGESRRKAYPGDQISLELVNELNISQGSILSDSRDIGLEEDFIVDILWMADQRLKAGECYLVKEKGNLVTANIVKILYSIDFQTGEKRNVSHITKNMVARCEISLQKQIPVIANADGSKPEILLIDRDTLETSGYGKIVKNSLFSDLFSDQENVTMEERESAIGQKSLLITAAGEESIKFLRSLDRKLLRSGFHTSYLEGCDEDALLALKIRTLMEAGIMVLISAEPETIKKLEETSFLKERLYIIENSFMTIENLLKVFREVTEEF
ncbi:MAG: GTP-binding protein [Lachnospiraceae bacterium]